MRWGRRLRRKWRRMGKGVHGREPITPFFTHSLSCLGWRAPPSQMPPSLTWDYSLRSLFVLLAINLASVRQPRASDPCVDRSLLPCGPKRPPHCGSIKSGAAPRSLLKGLWTSQCTRGSLCWSFRKASYTHRYAWALTVVPSDPPLTYCPFL